MMINRKKLMNTTKTYKHEDFGEIVVLVGGNGNVWFYGEELAECAGFSNPQNAVGEYVDKSDKKVIRRKHLSVEKTYTIVNIYGALSLVLSSKRTFARELYSWLARIDNENRPKLGDADTYVKAFVVRKLREKVSTLATELECACKDRDKYKNLYSDLKKEKNNKDSKPKPKTKTKRKRCQQTSESVS